MNQNNQIPKLIGKTFAHLQNSVDNLVTKGFKKLASFEKQKPQQDESKAIEYSRKVAGFFGNMGKSYYKEYDKLKKKNDN